MSASPRVFVAGLFHETHNFLDGRTTWDDFHVLTGDSLLAACGNSSPLGGILEVAAEVGWQVTPGITAHAAPSATVADAAFETYWAAFCSLLSAAEQDGPIAAICLVLHGAMVCESIPDVEGVLLERIQQQLAGRTVPIFGVYDLHANFTPQMARQADCLVAYRCNPHTDGKESAVRAARLLDRCLQTGIVPRTFLAQPPLIWPPTGTGTDTDPMRSLVQQARDLQQRHPDFWEVNVNAGFAFSDLPETGVSFTVVSSGPAETAAAALDELTTAALAMAEVGNVVEEDVDAVLSRLDREAPGLTVLVEPSDNIGGGAPGDCTGLARAMLAHQLPNAAVCLCDPAAVAQLWSLPPGTETTLPLGGRGSRLDPGPLELTVTLQSVCDGRFELCDKQSHLATIAGDFFDMGRCAVVTHQSLTILLTSIKTPPMDLGQWRHVGLDPASFSFVGVKAAVSHRRAWDPISLGNFWVATPGPCSSRLTDFPFQHVRRPVFPLDPLAEVCSAASSK